MKKTPVEVSKIFWKKVGRGVAAPAQRMEDRMKKKEVSCKIQDNRQSLQKFGGICYKRIKCFPPGRPA